MTKTSITPPTHNFTVPSPGQIWELFSDMSKPNDNGANQFADGPLQYGMIVRIQSKSNPEALNVSIMMLSREINSMSSINILIPSEISGLSTPIVAQTWNIEWVSAQSLSHVTGNRLSRPVYDLLMAIGNYYHGLIDIRPSIQQIQDLGLKVADDYEKTDLNSYVDLVPPDVFKQVDLIFEAVTQAEREWLASSQPDPKSRINLGQWFQAKIETGWQSINDFLGPCSLNPALAVRSLDSDSPPSDNEVQALLDRLANTEDQSQARMLIKQLGELIPKSSDSSQSRAIQTLATLTQNTQDDETLWLLIETFWDVDPHHPSAGTRRIKLLDLGINCAGRPISLLVAVTRKANQKLAVLLQLHPVDGENVPANLKLKIFDEAGQLLHVVTARQSDKYLQFKFSGNSGEHFGIAVELGTSAITENFTL
jgi:Protein of unknown function (DUF1822)